jgi:hypothetical protein
MKIYGEKLNVHYQVEEANLRSLHVVWFQLQNIEKKTNK